MLKMINKHSTHIEDFVFTNHKRGLIDAVKGLQYIVENNGKDLSNAVSVKIDGAPAILWGYGEKGFFVASKSIFNKQSKINYSIDEIYENHSGELADKLACCFENLSKITVSSNKVYQGDLLYTNDLKVITHNNKSLVLFHPNTIVYAVESDSDVGKQILASKVGIAVHTEYVWDQINPASLRINKFGITVDQFKRKKDVFIVDTVSRLKKNNVRFGKGEYNKIIKQLNDSIELADNIDWNLFDKQQIVETSLLTFINKFIRDNRRMPNPTSRYDLYKRWVDQRVAEAIESKKTERGKQNVVDRLHCMITLEQYKSSIITLFNIFDLITDVKNVIIKRLNNLSMYQNFVIKSNGDFESTGEEGFVITTTSAKGAKLVDRYTFSRNNFSKEIIKGFQHK